MIVLIPTSSSMPENNEKNDSQTLANVSKNLSPAAEKVKQYLAYWFQLGKKVIIRNGEESLQPLKVIDGNRYSQEFEDCWQLITSPQSGDCYLEGSSETIAELLSPNWEMVTCYRCSMPIPMRKSGMPAEACPCHDICLWPNTEIPEPRLPVDSQARLDNLRGRLNGSNGRY